MTKPLDSSLISIRRILRVTEASARDLARKSNMATTELLTLQIVGDSPGVSPSSLAKAMSLSPVTLTVILQKLETKGFIEKVKSPGDKRRLRIEPTPAGLEKIKQTPDSLQEQFVDRFNQLDEWEQHQIAAVLGRVTSLLNAENIEAAAILHVGSLT